MRNFKYISKNDPRLRSVYQDAIELIWEIQAAVRDRITFRYKVVGSYARNMVTYDEGSNIGFDLDFDLVIQGTAGDYSAGEIKAILRTAMKKVCNRHGYDRPEDSTRVLTIKCKDRKKSKIQHSIDFAVVRERECNDPTWKNGWYLPFNKKRWVEYIHFDKRTHQYIWEKRSNTLSERIEEIKSADLWNELRDYYLEKKNKNEDPRLHSRQLFSMAVNEVGQKNELWDRGARNESQEIQNRSFDAVFVPVPLSLCQKGYGSRRFQCGRSRCKGDPVCRRADPRRRICIQ